MDSTQIDQIYPFKLIGLRRLKHPKGMHTTLRSDVLQPSFSSVAIALLIETTELMKAQPITKRIPEITSTPGIIEKN